MSDNTAEQSNEQAAQTNEQAVQKPESQATPGSAPATAPTSAPASTPAAAPTPVASPGAGVSTGTSADSSSRFPSTTALDTSDNPDDPKEALRLSCVAACKQVFDPEIPVNIHELGLIYGVDIDDDNNVKVTMTLTSPACPAAQDLPLEVRGRIAVLPKVNEVEVDITFAPPWSPERMSEAARVQLGFDL